MALRRAKSAPLPIPGGRHAGPLGVLHIFLPGPLGAGKRLVIAGEEPCHGEERRRASARLYARQSMRNCALCNTTHTRCICFYFLICNRLLNTMRETT